jgi:hypothetical protein
MQARLALRFPRQYGVALLRRAGITLADDYERWRRSERAVLEAVMAQCGEGFRDLLAIHVLRFPALPELAARLHVPFVEVNNINSPESAQALTSWQPDVIASLGDRIIQPHILSIPRLGVLNGHSSLLPSYRGTTTEFWQIFHGESETGVTIHWMAPEVDEGAILVQARWPIPAGADHWQLRRASQFLRIEPWRQALRIAANGERGEAQPRSTQPTFGAPSLTDIYECYVLGHRRPRP